MSNKNTNTIDANVLLENAKKVLIDVVAEERRAAKPVLSSMVSAFRAHQAAWRMRRVQYSDTGSINPEKLAQYKLTDDIFLRRKMVPNAQNHGIVVHVDWSGSMSNIIATVVYQTLTMIWFCESINIPIEVYAFTTSDVYNVKSEDVTVCLYRSSESMQIRQNMQAMMYAQAIMHSGVHRNNDRLGMDEHDGVFGKAPKAMSGGIRRLMKSDISYDTLYALMSDRRLYMGGTPLFKTIFDSVHYIREFRNRHAIDQCISLWLTDGGDGSGISFDKQNRITVNSYFTMVDPFTGKTYASNEKKPAMAAMFEMHRDRTGATVICMDISDAPGGSVSRVLNTDSTRKFLGSIGIEGRVTTANGSVMAKPQRQTKRSIVMAPKAKFSETGMAIATRDEFPEMGCDVYIVSHPAWWGDSFIKNEVTKQANRWIEEFDDEFEDDDDIRYDIDDDDDDEFDDDSIESKAEYAERAYQNQRVDISSALVAQSATVSMRKFTNVLMPHIAAGR